MSAILVMSDDEVARFGRDSEAGFGALQTARGTLPLVAMDVSARVAGVVATVELAQTFVNALPVPIEATYIFPLPDRAAVHRFQMEVGGRVIDGVIDERGAARASYDQAIAAGHRAAITEEERPGVFTIRVGNLMPGDRATVKLALVGPLPVDDGEVTFRFPLVVAPRYIPGGALGGEQAGLGVRADTSAVPDASRISPPVRLPGLGNPVQLGLRVALEDGVMRAVASSLHAVSEQRRDAQVIEVLPGERLDRDFILRWRIDDAELRSTLVCADDGMGGGTFALTVVPPSTTTVAARPRDVVFVLDRSGSMQGWKMVAARRALARMVDTLTSRDRFAVIAFDDRVDMIPGPEIAHASDRERFRAVERVAKIEARGGTELMQPLGLAHHMLQGGTADRERMIVLVTDGQVGNEGQILGALAPQLRNIKVFTLGIDQAVNAAFLRQLAAAGGGLCELVESEDRLDDVMTKVHRRIGTPIATELAVAAHGFTIDPGTVTPAKLPDAYAGAPVVVMGRYRGSLPAGGAIELTGTSLGEPLRVTVPAARATTASWLAASWARGYLGDLDDRYAAEPIASRREAFERVMVQVSKQYSVLCRFTAFVAVDRSQVVNKGGVLHQVVQAVEQPAGWAAPAPATPMYSKTMTGVLGGMPAPGSAAGNGMIMQHAMSRSRGGAADGVPDGGPPAGGAPMARGTAAMPAPFAASPMPPSGPLGNVMPPRASPPRPEPAPEGGASRADEVLARDWSGDFEEARVAKAAVPRHEPADAYLAALARLTEELRAEAAQLAARPDRMRLRLLRQRLVAWSENARSTARGELADAVDVLIGQLSALIVRSEAISDEIVAICEALAELAAGVPAPVVQRGRPGFWKR